MLTRYAFFEGCLVPGCDAAFRQAVQSELLPTWEAYPGAVAVRVSFATERDEGAPSFPLILAVDFPDHAALALAMASAERLASRAATQRVLPAFFTGKIHHHVTEGL